jgi:hypothetical protein
MSPRGAGGGGVNRRFQNLTKILVELELPKLHGPV